EFALSLPMLLVFLVGIIDFGTAWNIKQSLNNAAREGARFGSSESTLDLNCSGSNCVPPSVTAIPDVVATYLANANITKCTIGTTASKSNYQWTFSSSSTGCSSFSLIIDRGYVPAGSSTEYTKVSLTYPYAWVYYNQIITLLGGSSGSSVNITTDASMQN